MKYSALSHPTEEILTEFVLDNVDSELEQHLITCNECKEFVEDVRLIKNDIAAVEENEIPPYLYKRIMAITTKKKLNSTLTFIQKWYKCSFFYGILTVLFVILIYAILLILM